jgi:uncharacterized protein (DUF169 family)
MQSTPRDYSVFSKFNFERSPVGVKYLLNRPDGIERLDKEMALCEMFKEAQEREPFYVSQENFACLGSLVLGMEEPEPIVVAGEIGAKEGIYNEARANKRIYQYVHKLPRDTVRYVAFSPVDRLSFDPDILIITGNVSQAEIILRAASYTTGKILTTKSTPVIVCSWLFAYPYVSGELNYTISGLGTGMKARKVLPEGLMLISVPYDILPMLTENLQEMQWVLPLHKLADEDEEYFKRTAEEIRQEYMSN